MTATDNTLTARHTPSVSELQAALLAARNGQFASPKTTPVVAAPPPRPEVATPPAAAFVATPPAAPPAGPAPSGGAGVWLLGTHGGSGVRYLAALLAGTRSAGKLWPAPSSGREPVVLVCRGNQRGLSSAQEYARTYRDRELGAHLDLLGVIVSADAPGRVPPPLRRLERLLAGAVPILGRVPWEPTWRLGPPTADGEPLPWVGQLDRALAAAAVPR